MVNQEEIDSELAKIGKRIHHLRKRAKMTQVDLEIATGISHADISRIENGKQNAEIITYLKIAKALNVELHELFIFTENVD